MKTNSHEVALAVDVDGVLLDLMISYCELFNERYDTNYTKNDVISWEFFLDWNISEEKAFQIFYELYENSKDIPVIDKAVKVYLEDIYKNKIFKPDIVSARKNEYKKPLVDALKLNGIIQGIHYEKLILVDNKPYNKKINFSYDIYIDDNPYLALSIKDYPEKVLLLYNQPWNRSIEDSAIKNVIRVYSWKDVYHYILNFI
ncbi:MAG: hypothetical protein GF317_04190 [Candidatus Lokiarchaeota archaeon]|nr:hypothetical protein [Candidatus Lokiarchaeota archaeon]MBD3199087.1 hypothetical protein [Candidatus Lokiarchaeota archaeon]